MNVHFFVYKSEINYLPNSKLYMFDVPGNSQMKNVYRHSSYNAVFWAGRKYRAIGKTVLKEEGFSSKWVNWAVKNACVRSWTTTREWTAKLSLKFLTLKP